jgi:FkbM family methyltransferase
MAGALQSGGRWATRALLGERLRERRWSRALYLRLYLFAKSIAERRQREFVATLVGPGQVVLDVGANVGFYTRLFAARVGTTGAVHAFEPDPLSRELLVRRCAGLPQVTVVASAVGATAGTAVLHTSTVNRADNRLHASHAPAEAGERIEVTVTTLDEHCARNGLGRVDAVKLDVQGFEVAALRGFRDGLAGLRPAHLLIELSPEHLRGAGSDALELLALLSGAGYDLLGFDSAHRPSPIADAAAFARAWDRPGAYTDVWARRHQS